MWDSGGPFRPYLAAQCYMVTALWTIILEAINNETHDEENFCLEVQLLGITTLETYLVEFLGLDEGEVAELVDTGKLSIQVFETIDFGGAFFFYFLGLLSNVCICCVPRIYHDFTHKNTLLNTTFLYYRLRFRCSEEPGDERCVNVCSSLVYLLA